MLALPANLGFGGGSNAGFRAATNDIVVLLNSDMRVEPDFLAPLLEGFTDAERLRRLLPDLLQRSGQAPRRDRPDAGLVAGRRPARAPPHRRRDRPISIPASTAAADRCAFDRAKFLELGGFDPLLAPFYLEDTDLGYMAWKRGWKVLYQPRSVVYHEHRGTIGKKLHATSYIQAVLKKNFLLFCWKNIHEWPRLRVAFLLHLGAARCSACCSATSRRARICARCGARSGSCRRRCASRWRARSLAADRRHGSVPPAAGRLLPRPLRRRCRPAPERLRVLFVSPYPICPPVHGGGVFMYQTLRELAKLAEVHVVELLDQPEQVPANEELREFCASAGVAGAAQRARRTAFGSMRAARRARVRQRRSGLADPPPDLPAARSTCCSSSTRRMAQYAASIRRIVDALFEHDVYFQSIARGLGPHDRARSTG